MDHPIMNMSFSELSIQDRLTLVERIWDSIVAEQEKLELSPEVCDELDRRMAEFEANPDEGISWDEVKIRLGIKSP